MVKKKVKGFVLMEMVISIFLVSLIALGLMTSLVNITRINKKIKIMDQMISVGNSAMEEAMAGSSYRDDLDFQIQIERSNYSENLEKIQVRVRCDEIDEEVQFVSYKSTKD